uniref:hypothetical protein n=1 Tax=Paracoccus mutanolyticus TaxID=1499308 RepID=UPI001CB91E17|nr:hypothetical protein [Paracoccus mutanolyticus]
MTAVISNMALLEQFVEGCKRPEELLGDAGLMKELKVRLMERMLGAELTAHLGYELGAVPAAEACNRRNRGREAGEARDPRQQRRFDRVGLSSNIAF